MAIAPIDYTSGNGFLQGLQGYGLYQQVQQRKAQAEQARVEQEAAQQFQQDWKAAYASGDPSKMEALLGKYPGQLETIKNAIGFRDDNHRLALGNAARDFRIAIASGNPHVVQQAAIKNADTLASVGSSPEEVIKQFQQDPKGLAQIVDAVGLGALGAKDFYGVQSDRGKLAETIRSNQAGEALTARGQDIQIRGQNISAENARLSREIQREELKEKALDRQIARETNIARLGELQQKQTDARQKQADAQQKKIEIQSQEKLSLDNGLQQYQRLKQEAQDILNSPYIGRVTGISGVIPSLPGGKAADLDAKIETLKSQSGFAVLQAMRDASKTGGALGNVSNFEVQQLQSNLGNLNGKQSTESLRKNLQKIINYADAAQGRLNKAFYTTYPDYRESDTQETQKQQDVGYSSLWGD